jgi:hypothetical protein
MEAGRGRQAAHGPERSALLALFLAPKMYGYKTPDYEKVVIADVKPDTVSFEELTKIWQGETIFKERLSFSKSLKDMYITSNTTLLTLRLDSKEIAKTPVYYNNTLSHYRPPKI